MSIDSQPIATDESNDNEDSEERPISAHTVVLESFVHAPVLDFDVFCEIIGCSTATVERASDR